MRSRARLSGAYRARGPAVSAGRAARPSGPAATRRRGRAGVGRSERVGRVDAGRPGRPVARATSPRASSTARATWLALRRSVSTCDGGDLPVQRRARVEQRLERGARVDARPAAAAPWTCRCGAGRRPARRSGARPGGRAAAARVSAASTSRRRGRARRRCRRAPRRRPAAPAPGTRPPRPARNMSAIDLPVRSTIIASTSVNPTARRRASTRPTVVFPAPGGPTRTSVGRLSEMHATRVVTAAPPPPRTPVSPVMAILGG